jgi:hypothetical protein
MRLKMLSLIAFIFIWLNNLKVVEGRNQFFSLKYTSCRPVFATPCTLPPGAAASLPFKSGKLRH